jgi:pseudaminic acid synthase
MNKFFFSDLKRPFLIAEISSNHCGSIKKAKQLICMAKKYDADAVKFQTFAPETMTINSKKKDFKISEGLWKGHTLWNLYQKAQTPLNWHKELFNYSKKIGIKCFSSAFDETSVDFLEKLNTPFYKIASFEITDLPLIKKVANTRKPMIISTGLSSIEEIKTAYKIAKSNGCREIALLYCVSAYPAKESDINLNNIKILKEAFGCTVGFSDHTNNPDITIAAVAAGAEIIEKHIALDNQKKGFDIAFSVKKKEFLNIRKNIDKIYKYLGDKNFRRSKNELKNKRFRRSVYVVKKIQKGELFSNKNIKNIRPGYSINPKYYEELIGKKSPKNLLFGSRIDSKVLNKVLNKK